MNYSPLPWKMVGCAVVAANEAWVFKFGVGIVCPDAELAVKAVNHHHEMILILQTVDSILERVADSFLPVSDTTFTDKAVLQGRIARLLEQVKE